MSSETLETLPTLRQTQVGSEKAYYLEDASAYRKLCEHVLEEGYDFPQCLSGVDMGYGLRSVLHLRRLKDHAEVAIAIDVPYDKPHVPSVTDLWGGVEWHEREAYDLLGIHYDDHPDHRRILLEDDWTIHPLQRRYDTGGYLIPDWQPQPWPDWEAIEKANLEEAENAKAAAKAKAEAAKAKGADKSAGKPAEKPAEAAKAAPKPAPIAKADAPEDDLTRIMGITKEDEAKLKERGIKTYARIAKLNDKAAEKYASELGFGRRLFDENWREQAAKLMSQAKEGGA